MIGRVRPPADQARWLSRLATAGASDDELAVVEAHFGAQPAAIAAAAATLVTGIADEDLEVMLNTWRTFGCLARHAVH